MESVDTLDKVRLDNVHGLSGHCPLFPWTMSMDSLGNVHGLNGKSGQCPWILWTKSREPTQTGQCPWTQWILSTIAMEIVHGLPGQFP